MQGTTLNMAEIDIGRTVFEYGQIYVALSRIKSLDGLYLLNFHPYKIKANPKVIAFYKLFENNTIPLIEEVTPCVEHNNVSSLPESNTDPESNPDPVPEPSIRSIQSYAYNPNNTAIKITKSSSESETKTIFPVIRLLDGTVLPLKKRIPTINNY
jgi:hypothetical protein